MSHCTTRVSCSVLRVLQCALSHICHTTQHVTVHDKSELQCVAECCRVLQYALSYICHTTQYVTVQDYELVAASCSELQCALSHVCHTTHHITRLSVCHSARLECVHSANWCIKRALTPEKYHAVSLSLVL